MTHYEKITFSKVSKSFSGTPLFCDVDITLRAGKVILLTGENGSGKTTLLRILAGLLKPDFGQVNFSSVNFCLVDEAWKQARKRLLENVMYLHQRPYMFAGSVSRNLALAVPKSMTGSMTRSITGAMRGQTKTHIDQALEWGMLTQHALANAKTLSGGQQQRVALARAWLRQSPIMLLDEPVANMDTHSSSRTITLLHQLKHANTAILICSHHQRVFDSLIDQHVELVNNRLMDAGTISHIGNVASIHQEASRDNAVG